MAHLVIDTETTTKNKGNPFQSDNKLCVIACLPQSKPAYALKVDYDEQPYGAAIEELRNQIAAHDVIVMFNGKFDLHWLRRYGVYEPDLKVWDVQLAHFILSRQLHRLPSLNEVAEFWGVGKKLDKIKEYWDQGVDTKDIPYNELEEYALEDVRLTEACYLKQKEAFEKEPALYRAFRLCSQDLMVLQEMEWNGMKFDIKGSLEEAAKVEKEMEDCRAELVELVPNSQQINWNSPQQVAAVLYGGPVEFVTRTPYLHTYKNGNVKTRYKEEIETHIFPQLVKPPYKISVSDDVIKNLKCGGLGKRVIELLRKYSRLEKLHGTYLAGIPKKAEELGWGDVLHGKLNQTIAVTGRLSSSDPNMQNMPGAVDQFFISRFEGGSVIQFDVKGLEVVVAAYLSQDATLINELNQGEDIHSNNQNQLGLPDRLTSKRFMFKMIYGGSAVGFAKDADFMFLKWNADYWQKIIDNFYRKYKGIAAWHKKLTEGILRTGYYEMPSGRQLDYRELLKAPDWYFVPKIKNYPVQGFGAEIVAVARISLFKRIRAQKVEAKLVNTIHDSIILDIPKEECYTILTIVKQVFKDLPTNMQRVWNINFGMAVNVEASNLTTGEELNAKAG